MEEIEVHLENDKKSSEQDLVNEEEANFNQNEGDKEEHYIDVQRDQQQISDQELEAKQEVSETRIKAHDHKSEKNIRFPFSETDNRIDLNPNELISNGFSSKEEIKSKHETEKEGEGDILDTIGDLDFDNFQDRRRPIKKVFSESNHGNL